MGDYVVCLHKIESKVCALSGMSGLKRSFRLKKGIPLLAEWPSDVEMHMDPDRPNDTVLQDSLFNTSSLLVVSGPLKEFLTEAELPDVEFLPLRITKPSGGHLEEPYFVVNLTEHVDCLDPVASQAEEGMAGRITEVKGIVLKQTELLEGRKLFRLERFGGPTLVDRAFAAELDARGFTGIRWGELGDYTDKNW